MNKYQIVERAGKFNHAGSKATADVADIAEKMGFKPVYVDMDTTDLSKIAKIKRQIGYLRDYKKIKKTIPEGATVLLQHPFHHKQLTRNKTLKYLKETKKVKYICMVHDVEELRQFRYNDYYKEEFEFMLEIADVIIVHNDKMKAFFERKNVANKKLIVLDIFDYIQDGNTQPPVFEKSITIAGNLDTTKCGYVGGLTELKNVKINLYGSNFDQAMSKYDNVEYFGSFPPEEIPKKLKSGFGLVWDGSGIDGCMGESGQYLRYNNPHKLSLYLSSGIPVITWSQAAEADFVRKHKTGICVDSLRELDNILANLTEEEYNEFVKNCNKIGQQLRQGYYAKTAITKALQLI